jgi:hypothetical protein
VNRMEPDRLGALGSAVFVLGNAVSALLLGVQVAQSATEPSSYSAHPPFSVPDASPAENGV